MKLSIFNALNTAATINYELPVITTGDWCNMMVMLTQSHIGGFANRIESGITEIMNLLDKSNSDLAFVSVINNSIAIGFTGGLTVDMVINYSKQTVAVNYNLPTFC